MASRATQAAAVRRIMHKFIITEISGCRRPTQEGARVAIMKSADAPRKETDMELSPASKFIRKFGVDFDKAAIADHLDGLVKNRASECGESYPVAYAKTLETEQGAELYAGYRTAPEGKARVVEQAPPPSRKTEKAQALETALDALARQHAELHKTSLAKAYDEFLRTPTGSRIYAELRAAA
jgi:hypothetical protein